MPAALKPCAIDTNVLIDLEAGRVLLALFGLPLYLMTTDFVIDELQEPDGQQLQRYGLVSCELSPDGILELARLKSQYPRTSIADLSVLVLARATKALLLTGEKNLRAIAEREGMTVHGTLWLLDEMVSRHVIIPPVAFQALRRMLQRGSRLPRDRCRQRLARWRARGQS
jgi:hypothetical protein